MSQIFSGELDRNEILQKLNDDKAKVYYPAIIYMGILILPGTIGNLLVLYIYFFKKPRNSLRIFVCFLAAIDLIACLICFPFIMCIYLYPLIYYNNTSCKITFFLSSCVLIGNAFTMIAIGVERYRKVCKPHSIHISLKIAKHLCILILFLTVLFSTPMLHFYGSSEISTNHPNITGYECYVQVELRDTGFHSIYGGFLLIGSLGCCTALIVLYILIGIKLWRQEAKMRKHKMDSLRQCQDHLQVQEPDQAETEPIQTTYGFVEATQLDKQDYESNQPESSEQETSFSTPANKFKQDENQLNNFIRIKKTTKIFILITVLYVLGLLPFPILRLYQILNNDWHADMSYYAQATIFLNNVINSVVYTICDSNYRRELKSCYSKIFCRK